MIIHPFEDKQTLEATFAAKLISILTAAIEARGQAYLVVPGGKTPVSLFQRLAKQTLPWQKVTILLTDERCVLPTEQDSNEYMLRHTLLQHEAATANFISLYAGENTTSLAEVEKILSTLPTFDVVILGMGEDGHTASLFPGSDNLQHALNDNHTSAMTILPPIAPYKRISLTKSRLLNSRACFLYLIGEKKMTVLKKAAVLNNPFKMPICAFTNQAQIALQVMFTADNEV